MSKKGEHLSSNWVNRGDIEHMARIAKGLARKNTWLPEDFWVELRERNTVGQTIKTKSGKIVGYFVYCIYSKRLSVLDLGVDAALGTISDKTSKAYVAGKLIVDYLISKLDNERKVITIEVEEEDLSTQLFLRIMEFKAYDTAEGWIFFKYELEPVAEEALEDEVFAEKVAF
jgi:hypothetical protein